MNSYDFFIHEFICFMNPYMNLGIQMFQMMLFSMAIQHCYIAYKNMYIADSDAMQHVISIILSVIV